MLPSKLSEVSENCKLLAHKFSVGALWKWVIISGLVFYLIFIAFFNNPSCSAWEWLALRSDDSPTDLRHLVFGLIGSEKAWHQRQAYTQSWWRPNVTRGYLFLDKPPTGDLLPWSKLSPPYRVSDNLSKLIEGFHHPMAPIWTRIIHGIMEVFREEHGDLRWLVMGDDDSILFVDNIVDLLAKYDHTKYYYFGGQSEYINTNYRLSFNQGFGGAGLIFSCPLAKALANNMDNCITRYGHIYSAADSVTMFCSADIGVNLSPHKGLHQIDMHGDLSGFLSSHPHTSLLSLHHLDEVEPIFTSKDRFTSIHHLMKAANLDQSRILQQTICYQRQTNWSFSVSWGYSVYVYEQIMPRSMLQLPIETFFPWKYTTDQARFMFNTRVLSSNSSCEVPHVFLFNSIKKNILETSIRTVYKRALPRGLPACSSYGNQSADIISKIEVISPTTKRVEDGRCECCDIIHVAGMKTARVKFRKCTTDEIIA